MMLFIASEVMFFVAWFWIFFEMALFHHVRTLSPIDDVRTAWATWPPKGIETVPPLQLPLVNTLTLLLSGTTVTWAHHALQSGDREGAKIGLIADHRARPAVHLRSRPTSTTTSSPTTCSIRPKRRTPASMARPSSWPPASTAST